MPGRASKERYRAMLEDVRRRVTYAAQSGDYANPYPVEDKRHVRFARELRHACAVAFLFDETCAEHGCDTTAWGKRSARAPGPVRPLP